MMFLRGVDTSVMLLSSHMIEDIEFAAQIGKLGSKDPESVNPYIETPEYYQVVYDMPAIIKLLSAAYVQSLQCLNVVYQEVNNAC